MRTKRLTDVDSNHSRGRDGKARWCSFRIWCGSRENRFEKLGALRRPATLRVAISAVANDFDGPGSRRRRDLEATVVARTLGKKEGIEVISSMNPTVVIGVVVGVPGSPK
ncbi:hypothetical protein DEO72_LG4g229 [Vigna unguiculata]|uniref:Uncharacterized protein n=1 Tax=Vigna unguiculata TaxID=3917 RepID=A0A4D6LLU4_VIGUN|nr:hypothetical protein DEO72_LG4g229 [Vigna unguiculata]